MAGEANGVIAAGGARWSGPVTTLIGGACTVLMAPEGGFPPTGGGWWLYQRFSTQLTTVAPPFSRVHSANREATEVPRAGLVKAPPSEIPSQMSKPTNATEMANRMRRRVFRRTRPRKILNRGSHLGRATRRRRGAPGRPRAGPRRRCPRSPTGEPPHPAPVDGSGRGNRAARGAP